MRPAEASSSIAAVASTRTGSFPPKALRAAAATAYRPNVRSASPASPERKAQEPISLRIPDVLTIPTRAASAPAASVSAASPASSRRGGGGRPAERDCRSRPCTASS